MTCSVQDVQQLNFNTVLKLFVHHITTGEGNSEDAVIILQQQQGEGWAEVFNPFQ